MVVPVGASMRPTEPPRLTHPSRWFQTAGTTPARTTPIGLREMVFVGAPYATRRRSRARWSHEGGCPKAQPTSTDTPPSWRRNQSRRGAAMSDRWFEGAAWCTGCQWWKPAEDFPANPRMWDGRSSHCRACHAAASRRWREANRDYVDARNAARRAEYAVERGPLERVCANPDCRRTYVPTRRDSKTCSKSCRDRARYLRKSARPVEAS
jgi:hypothetical protein